jgi:hypothetical protein
MKAKGIYVFIIIHVGILETIDLFDVVDPF